jgi:hypothetical protein
MNSEVVDVNAPAANEAAKTPKAVAIDSFEEFGTVEITGNFRGYWRDVPVKNEDGSLTGEKRRMFKLTRSVKLKDTGAVVRQAAWVTEADAKKANLIDGVKYNLTLSVGEELTPSKQNGDERYVDEYSFGDATILSVNS